MASYLTVNESSPLKDFLGPSAFPAIFGGNNFQETQFDTGQELVPDHIQDFTLLPSSVETALSKTDSNNESFNTSVTAFSPLNHEVSQYLPTSNWPGPPGLSSMYGNHRTNLTDRKRIIHSASPSLGPTHHSFSPHSLMGDSSLDDPLFGRFNIKALQRESLLLG
jgi:hypothetical protein